MAYTDIQIITLILIVLGLGLYWIIMTLKFYDLCDDIEKIREKLTGEK